MADLSKSIEIVFGAVDKTGGAITSVSKGLDAIGTKVGAVTGPIADFTESLIKIELAAAAAGAALLGLSVNESGKFNDALAEINTLVDTTGASFEQFKTLILEYAKDSTQSIESINGAIYNAISAGVKYEDLLRGLENGTSILSTAERLAVSSKTDLNTALSLLVSTLNAYNLNVDDAARVSDLLFTAVRDGKTTLPEIAASLAQVSSVAAGTGIPLEQVLAALTTLTAGGFETSAAITGVRGALSNIIGPSGQARDLAEKLRIEFNAEALAAKGLDGILQSVKEATGGNVSEMKLLFGSIEGFNAVLRLTGAGAEKFRSDLLDMENATGAVAAAFSEMANNFGLANQNLKNIFDVMLITIGDQILPSYKDLTGALGDVMRAFIDAANSGVFDELFASLEGNAEALKTYLLGIAAALPEALQKVDFTGLISAFDQLGVEIGGLFDGVDLTKPEGLAEAIQFLVDSGESLIRTTAGIVKGFSPLIDVIVKAVSEYNDLSEQQKFATGEGLGFATMLDKLLPGVGFLADALNVLSVAMTAAFGTAALKNIQAIFGASGLGAASALAGTIGKAGLAGAVAAASYEFGAWLNSALGISDTLVDIAADTLGLNGELSEHEQYIIKADAAHRRWLATSGEIKAGLNDLLTGTDEYGSKLREQAKDIDQNLGVLDQMNLLLEKQGASYRIAADGTVQYVDKTTTVAETAENVVSIHGKLITVIKDANGNIVGYTDNLKGVATSYQTIAKDTKTATEQSEEFKQKMLELASNERIKNIEAKVSLDVAELESQTKIVQSAFDSINETISSTGDLLGALFGNLADANTWSQRDLIEKQIEIENQRREEALALQKDLTQAQIEYIREKTKTLAKGDSLVNITADGLEPEIEAFMWKIIHKIQVRANQEGAEFLLGVAA